MSKRPVLSTGTSLRASFLAAIGLAWLVVGAGSYVVFSASASRLSASYAARFALVQSELERNRILSLVDRELILSRKFASDPDLIAWMEDEDRPDLRARAISSMDGYRRFLRDGACFVANLASRTYTGQARDGSFKVTTLNPEVPADRWFFNILKSGANWLMNVDHDVILGENRVWINVVVRDIHGKILGVAGSGLNLSSFVREIVEGGEEGTQTIIVDREGRLQASKDLSLIRGNAEATRDEDKADIYELLPDLEDRTRLASTLAVAALGGRPGPFPVKLGQENALLAIGALPELGWYSLVFVDASSVLGFRDFLPFGLVTLASLLLVFVGVLAFLNRLVLEPIGLLTRAAAKISAGAYDLGLPQASRNEIGSLTASFGSMAARIREYTEGLEDQVAARTAELTAANLRLATEEKRILDSIEYARLIQDSIFPRSSDLETCLAGHFMIARPRDLVGGDFVYFRVQGPDFWAAVVDCTGHGVPGAFMTMMVKALLDGLILSAPEGVLPSAILLDLDARVRTALSKETEMGHLENGLDIGLCHYRRSDNLVEFSGAGLSLYVQGREGLEELGGSRVHLGFASRRSRARLVDQRIEGARGCRFYLVSDGVLDLPGGREGHGLGRSRLKDLLGRLSALPLASQGRVVESELDDWQGNRAPRDDLTFFAFCP